MFRFNEGRSAPYLVYSCPQNAGIPQKNNVRGPCAFVPSHSAKRAIVRRSASLK